MDHGGESGEHLKAKASAPKKKHVEFKPLISTVISDCGSVSKPDSETNLEGIGHGSAKNPDSCNTASPSSSNSSDDDSFQVNPQTIPKIKVQNNIPKPKPGTKPLHKNEKFNVSSEALYRLKESINESPKSTSRFSDVTHESLVSHMSPTLSPSIQVMDRHGGFDPNRIPDSVFDKPSTQMDWSAASNDSLFSIRIGNSSFSREHTFRMGVNLNKSGELPKSGELLNSAEFCQSGETFKSGEPCKSGELFQPGEPCKSVELPQSGEIDKFGELNQSREQFVASDLKRSGELTRFRQTFPTTKGVEPIKNLDVAKTIREDMKHGETRTVEEPIDDVPKALMNNRVDRNIGESRDSSSANHHPDKSKISIQPFPSPKKKKSSYPLCHCPDCCPTLCCCKSCWCKCSACSCKCRPWPSCSFKWFIWPCCSRNCLSWLGCCCKWPSCHCKYPNWSSCCCMCHSWPRCKCPSWPSCKCPCWPSCKCRSPNCTWACCCCWKREPKRSCSDSSQVSTDGMQPISKKASSKRRCSCFLCSSTCSFCSCWSCSCCS